MMQARRARAELDLGPDLGEDERVEDPPQQVAVAKHSGLVEAQRGAHQGGIDEVATARLGQAREPVAATLGGHIARVGATQLNDPAGRSQMEIDIVAVPPRRSETVGLLGEAMSSGRPAGIGVLARLERARDLLLARATVATDVKLAVFSAGGFDPALLDA